MVLISRTPPGKTGRHYVGSFEFTEAERAAMQKKSEPVVTTAPKPSPSIQITQSRMTTPSSPRPIAKKKVPPPPRPPRVGRPFTPAVVPQSIAAAANIGRIGAAALDDAQRESILDGLSVREHLIGAEIMVQVKSLIAGKITGISIKPTPVERNIFHLLGIPGFS